MERLRIKTVGFRGHDIDIEVGARVLLLGQTGSGKSTWAQALTIAVLGHDPSLGKTPAATAQVMRGRFMELTVTLPDRRWFWRTLKMMGEGSYETSARCSWLKSDSDKAHEQEIIKLFGADKDEAAENLALRELNKLSGPARAGKLLALMEAGADPQALQRQTTRYWLQCLTGISDAHMPDDHLQLRTSIDGFDGSPAANHTGQYAALKAAEPKLASLLTDSGVAGALNWAKEELNAAQAELRDSNAAKAEHETRLQELGEILPERVTDLEAARSELERDIGAAGQRAKTDAAHVETIEAARKERQSAEDNLKAATTAWEAVEKRREEVRAKKGLLQGVTKGLDELTVPPPMPGITESQTLVVARGKLQSLDQEIEALKVDPAVDYADAEAIEKLVDEADAAADAIIIPEPPADMVQRVADARAAVTVLVERRRRADASPIKAAVQELAAFRDALRDHRVPKVLATLIEAYCERQHQTLVTAQGDENPAEIGRLLKDAEAALEAAEIAVDEAATERAAAINARQVHLDRAEALTDEGGARRAQIVFAHAGVLAQRKAKREQYQTQREQTAAEIAQLVAAAEQHYNQATADLQKQHEKYELERRALTTKRDEFTKLIDELTAADAAGEKAFNDAKVFYEAAEQRWEDLTAITAPSVDAPGASVETLEAQLATVKAEIEEHTKRAAVQAELERLIAKSKAAEATRIVFARLADALGRIRGETVTHAGGPLVERLTRFLVGAGRTEKPFVHADKQTCVIGWERKRGESEERITLDAMCGGEAGLYGAGFADAVTAIRQPRINVLLCEVAELDDGTVGQLLAGIDAVRDSGFCVVMSSHEPRTIPDNWEVIRMAPIAALKAA